MWAARNRILQPLVLVILMDRRSRVVVGVFVVVVVGMTVGQISMGMFMIVVDHRCRSLAVKASATLAHVGLLAPGTRQFDDNEMPYGNPFRPEGKGSEIAQNLHKTHTCATYDTYFPRPELGANTYPAEIKQLYILARRVLQGHPKAHNYLHSVTGATMYPRIAILSLLLILFLAGGVQAYKGGCPGQGHAQDFMSGLSPEQQEKVRKLTDSHHEELFALNKELKARHQAMEALFDAVPADKAAIDKAVADVSEVQAKKARLNADYRVALSEIAGKPFPKESGKGCGAGAGCGAYSSDAGHGGGNAPCPHSSKNQ